MSQRGIEGPSPTIGMRRQGNGNVGVSSMSNFYSIVKVNQALSCSIESYPVNCVEGHGVIKKLLDTCGIIEKKLSKIPRENKGFKYQESKQVHFNELIY